MIRHRDTLAHDAGGAEAVAELRAVAEEPGNASEHVAPVCELLECRVRHPVAHPGGCREHDTEEPQFFGLLHGQRPQQHGIYDTEDGGVGGDAEREHEERDEREAGAAAETAECVDHILPNRVEHGGNSIDQLPDALIGASLGAWV